MVNLYAVLGVQDNATQQEIHDAHMRLTQKPDGLTDGRLRDKRLLDEAWDRLTTTQKKKNYDQRIKKCEQELQDKAEEATTTRVKGTDVAEAAAAAAAARRDKEQSLWEDTRRNALGR
ncbi:MAG: hypothetical protein Q9171_002421 [Xanthocarpia ochracea]